MKDQLKIIIASADTLNLECPNCGVIYHHNTSEYELESLNKNSISKDRKIMRGRYKFKCQKCGVKLIREVVVATYLKRE